MAFPGFSRVTCQLLYFAPGKKLVASSLHFSLGHLSKLIGVVIVSIAALLVHVCLIESFLVLVDLHDWDEIFWYDCIVGLGILFDKMKCLFEANFPHIPILLIELNKGRFALKLRISIFINNGYDLADHFLLLFLEWFGFGLDFPFFGVILTQILVEPHFNVALLVNAHLLLLYRECADVLEQFGVPDQHGLQAVHCIRERHITKITQPVLRVLYIDIYMVGGRTVFIAVLRFDVIGSHYVLFIPTPLIGLHVIFVIFIWKEGFLVFVDQLISCAIF